MPNGRLAICGRSRAPSASAATQASSSSRHRFGDGVGLEEEERHGQVELGREATHPVDLLEGGLGVLAVGAGLGQLEHGAVAGLGHGGGDAPELVLGGEGAGDGVARAGGVAEHAGGGEADGAGVDGLADEAAHLGDLALGGGTVLEGLLAHDVGAQRHVADVGGDVGGVVAAVEGVEELGEGLPVPRAGRRAARRRGCPRPTPWSGSASRGRRGGRGRTRCRRRRAPRW